MYQQEAKESNAIRQGDGTIVLSGFVKKLRLTWKKAIIIMLKNCWTGSPKSTC